jgi:DNA polymerase phi
MSGQEQRDMYFARLFGLTSIIQSGLLFRQDPPAYSSSPASSLEDFQKVLEELITLGEKKSWFRESCWWSVALALDVLFASLAPWKSQASNWALDALFPSGCEWTIERAGIWIKYHQNWGQKASGKLAPKLKTSHPLATANLPMLARVLRVRNSTTPRNQPYLSL